MKEEKFKLFWRGEFSQWYKADMYDPITGLTFNCCEQFMMYGKAKLFGDEEAMEDIMSTSNPRKQQAIFPNNFHRPCGPKELLIRLC